MFSRRRSFIVSLFVIGSFLSASNLEAKDKKETKLKTNEKIISLTNSQSLKSGGSKKRYYPEAATPALCENQVFAGTHSGVLYAFDLNGKNKKQWQVETSGPIASQPVCDASNVYVGSIKGYVTANDRQSGKEVWREFVGGEVLGAPVINGNSVVVVTSSREVYALDRDSGREVWAARIKGYERKITQRGNASITKWGGSLILGFADGQVVSLSGATGSIQWSKLLASAKDNLQDIDSTLLADGNSLYAAGVFGGVFKLSAANGETIWKKEIKSSVDLSQDEKNIFVSTEDGHVLALDKQTGFRNWDRELASALLSSPTLVGDYLIVGLNDKGKLAVLSKANGSIRQYQSYSGGFAGNAVVSGDTFIGLSSGARLGFFKSLK